jgi:U3 small nucleolar ribonucleoprotein protein IMP3
MVRKLKYHEQKLLKKVDFLNVRPLLYYRSYNANLIQWKQDANLREIKVMRRYHVQDREDYHK